MITEVAVLNIKKDQSKLFEIAFDEAQSIISSMKGYIEHELLKCLEAENKYLLIVRWQTLEDHTEGFRKSARYDEWKNCYIIFMNRFQTLNIIKKYFKHYR